MPLSSRPLGIVFGHISLSQIKQTGEEGRGLAVAGLVISYVITALSILVIVQCVVHRRGSRLGNLDAFRAATRAPRHHGASSEPEALPEFKPPATLGSNCQYPATTEPASKPANRRALAGCRPTPRW